MSFVYLGIAFLGAAITIGFGIYAAVLAFRGQPIPTFVWVAIGIGILIALIGILLYFLLPAPAAVVTTPAATALTIPTAPPVVPVQVQRPSANIVYVPMIVDHHDDCVNCCPQVHHECPGCLPAGSVTTVTNGMRPIIPTTTTTVRV